MTTLPQWFLRPICEFTCWSRQLKLFQLQLGDLLTIYTGYVRPLVEYAVPVWHPGLTNQQRMQIERIKKRSLRIILGCLYITYENALQITKLKSLEFRRRDLCLKFAKSLQNSPIFRSWLPNPRENPRSLRRITPYNQIKCRTQRYKLSPIPYLISLLNES